MGKNHVWYLLLLEKIIFGLTFEYLIQSSWIKIELFFLTTNYTQSGLYRTFIYKGREEGRDHLY